MSRLRTDGVLTTTPVEAWLRRAQRSPEAPAVEQDGRCLTRGDLLEAADRVVTLLGPYPSGSTVGVAMRRGAGMVAANVGLTLAGCAYVPLDLTAPSLRRAAMATAAGVDIVLTDDAGAALDWPAATPVLNGAGPVLAAPAAPPRYARRSADSPSYVIFTSGSSGPPKPVEIRDASLAHLLDWTVGALGLTTASRIACLVAPTFDASLWEMWSALCSGATLCVAPETARFSPVELQHWLCVQRVTVALVPTPVGQQLLSLDWPERPALTHLLIGGDRLHPVTGTPRLPFQVVNAYGPTEVTVMATAAWLSRADLTPPRVPPIGRPIGETRIRILGPDRQDVPDGSPGELHLGGPSVGAGYRDDPGLTARSFVPLDPARPEDMFYRTGDLVVRRHDGLLDFVGRVDRQVKVNGVRVEAGEVEAALMGHPWVSACAVRPWTSRTGDTRLMSYVQPQPGGRGPAPDFRAWLRDRLPGYLIPNGFLVTDLPLTGNGKIFYGELPAPVWAAVAGAREAGARLSTSDGGARND